MDIRSPVSLKQAASQALARGREPQKVITTYTGALILISAALTLVNFLLDLQLQDTGGLSNLGTHSILATVQTFLPIVQAFFTLGLEFGYLYAMLRIARGQYADHTDLKEGFRRFGPVLRLILLQSLLFIAIGLAVFYISMQVFLMTPWGAPVIELLMPTIMSGSTVLDEATALQAGALMTPMYIIFVLLFAAVSIPLLLRLRMASYALLDDSKAGAMAALRASWRMMRRNCLRTLKLDISFWWFYILQVFATALCYGDTICALLGVQLPLNPTVSFYLFYVLYLAVLFAINYFFRNYLETSYIMAYETLHEKPKDNAVVLGNIFDM